MSIVRWIVLPCLASGLMVLALVLAIRWISRLSRAAGIVVAAGFAVRLVIASALFWISYLRLPVLSSLQVGNGFWNIAIDATEYYQWSLYGAELGLHTITAGAPSPAYLELLAVWMRVFGTSPFSPVLLNLVCYVGTCALLVSVLRGLPARWFVRVSAATVLAVSASPMLLFVSTQALKDSLFLFFATLLGAGVWWTAWTVTEPALASWRRLAPGLLALSVGIFVTAGVRAYYPAIASGCFGFFVVAVVVRGRVNWPLLAAASLLVMAVSVVALLYGSTEGASYLRALTGIGPGGSAATLVERSRLGFAGSGGATNVVEKPPVGWDVDPKFMAGPSAGHFVRGLAVGLSTLFVPMTILRLLSVIGASGGAAMVALGDLDTLVFDAMVIGTAWFAWRLWKERAPNLPYFVFSLALALTLAGLMGYIVTNIGTLVRLRLMLLVPLWTLLFAFARPRGAGEANRVGGLPES
ncbi:MAG TPA: hypothetical protein VM032_16105 [Vicinamibacterales bacterium]|nr:hypothetical protein [Vicinamibacterales bacterium]